MSRSVLECASPLALFYRTACPHLIGLNNFYPFWTNRSCPPHPKSQCPQKFYQFTSSHISSQAEDMKVNPLPWLINILLFVAVTSVCFAFPNIVMRIISVLIALPAGVMSYCFFEHAITFRDWRKATGKRSTPPGQSIVIGTILLILAAFFVYCGIRH